MLHELFSISVQTGSQLRNIFLLSNMQNQRIVVRSALSSKNLGYSLRIPIAAPSANISGRPSPTNAQDVLEDMQGKIAGMLDGGNCGIGLESTVVDTTSAVPTILRPGGITYEMLTEVMGAVEIDPALQGDKNFKPKAPGMKYRHYAPKAPVYLFEGEACKCLPQVIAKALAEGKTVGVLCGRELESELAELVEKQQLQLSCWGDSREQLAADLFYLLRDFDRTCPDVILGKSGCPFAHRLHRW